MNDIIAFFSRCLLYSVFVVVSKLENTLVEFDMFERVVLTCLQICVLCAAWVIYECCAFIIRSVSRRAPYEVLGSSAARAEAGGDAAKTAPEPEPESEPEAEAEPGEPDEKHIVFENKGALRKYIMQVHMVGMVLWSTMLCSDYALDQTAFMFLLGMLLGNVATVAFKVHEKQMRAGKMRMYAVYWALIGVLVCTYLVHDGSKVIEYTEVVV